MDSHKLMRILRDLENIRELSLMEILVNVLPDKVGSPLSIRRFMKCVNSISMDKDY